MAATATGSGTPTATRGGAIHDHPIGAISLGLVVLAGALWGITAQVTTSEAMFTMQHAVQALVPHFGIFGQLGDLFNGKVSGVRFQAYTFAWGIEMMQFVFSMGIELPKHNPVFNWVFWIGNILLIVINSTADYLYNSASNGWQQLGFAIVELMMSYGLLYIALHLIIKKGIVDGIRMLRHH